MPAIPQEPDLAVTEEVRILKVQAPIDYRAQ